MKLIYLWAVVALTAVSARSTTRQQSITPRITSLSDKDAREKARTHPAFANAGQRAGLELWRIENFEPVAVAQKDVGKFYKGDSYIVLKTTADKRNNLSWDIHYWIGSETTQDEAGAAAILTVGLDDKFDGKAVQHRESMGYESSQFLGYFPGGGNRTQVQKPAIVIYNLKTQKQILRYELKDSDLVNERSPGGLTSITVDVTKNNCDDAYAYINDLATPGMVVFSLKSRNSWRLTHPSFEIDEKSLNFTVAGYTIPWRDGLFSIALSEPDAEGHRTAYYHPLVSTLEFKINTKYLKSGKPIDDHLRVVGTRGPNTQSGSHGYHEGLRTMFYANVAQDAILCWQVDNKMTPDTVGVSVRDHSRLVYISDLKVIGDDVWVLVNQMPVFVYSAFSPKEYNFFIHKLDVFGLLRDTPCGPPILL